MKKILSLLLALLMLTLTIPISSFNVLAEESTEVNSAAVQFPEGVGKSADNPAICNSFAEFKAAMENEWMPYVALGNCDEVIPLVEGDKLLPAAILVRGFKTLYLTGHSVFTAPDTKDGYCDFDALLYNTYPYAALRIYGPGSLTYKATCSSARNAVISNVGGNVYIHNATLKGSYNTAVYGRAIWQEYGELYVYDGSLIGESALYGGRDIDAVHLLNGKAEIFGGKFYSNDLSGNYNNNTYGLTICKDAKVDLKGGTFFGIKLPTDSTPLANYMDKDIYTPFTNGYWFNPQSEYSQEYVDSDKLVEIFRMVDKLDIAINSPVAGISIDNEVYNIPDGCYKHTVHWYEDDEYINSGAFTAGKSYRVEIYINAEAYGRFESPLTSATINGKKATVTTVGNDSSKALCLAVDFGICPATVPTVELTVTSPKEGSKPSYTVACGNNTYYAVGGSSNYTDYRKWYMSSDGYDWWEINGNHTFMSGYYYKLYVDIKTANGYEFLLDDNLDPYVTATVNGNSAKIKKAYDQDPSNYITVEYSFGECNDSVIENVVIDDVYAPVPGEKPRYTCSLRGNGYYLDVDKSEYYEEFVGVNAGTKYYYIKNGIGWFDMTDFDWVYENETFIPGHEYQVRIYLITEKGVTFWHDKYYDMLFTATVNGNAAEGNTTTNEGLYKQTISSNFTCNPVNTSLIMLKDIATPKAGNTPDYDLTAVHSDYYMPDQSYGEKGVIWYNADGATMMSDETFVQGKQYKLEIKIIPKKVDGANMCRFVSPVTAYVNGKQVTERLDWDAVYANDNTAYIYYTFTEGAAAPESSLFVSGQITSGGSATDDITIRLYKQNSNDLAYETTVQGNNTNYYIGNVKDGTYRLVATKSNHKTYETTLTVSESVIHNITLTKISAYTPGDVNNDGEVDLVDVVTLSQFVAGWQITCNEAALNTNGVGSVDLTDVVHLSQFVAGWQGIELH